MGIEGRDTSKALYMRFAGKMGDLLYFSPGIFAERIISKLYNRFPAGRIGHEVLAAFNANEPSV